jgi:hypothetical protein
MITAEAVTKAKRRKTRRRLSLPSECALSGRTIQEARDRTGHAPQVLKDPTPLEAELLLLLALGRFLGSSFGFTRRLFFARG